MPCLHRGKIFITVNWQPWKIYKYVYTGLSYRPGKLKRLCLKAAAHLTPVATRALASFAGWERKKRLLCSVALQLLCCCLIKWSCIWHAEHSTAFYGERISCPICHYLSIHVRHLFNFGREKTTKNTLLLIPNEFGTVFELGVQRWTLHWTSNTIFAGICEAGSLNSFAQKASWGREAIKSSTRKNPKQTSSILRLGAFGPSNKKTTLSSYRYTQMFQDELIIPADTWYVSDFI